MNRGRGELARPRQERPVDVDLPLHLDVVDDALGAAHLLDLEQQGLAVLEDEREVGPHLHAAPGLQRDHPAAPLLADLLVLEEVDDVSQLDHAPPSFGSMP